MKATCGNNQTYLMHWLLDVDNWYGFGNLLNPSHTATYVNTFQRGEQESVWEAIPHPSQDNQKFGKANEGFMSLFTKENNAPAQQWRYTNATDADARAVQAMYWAKELGYDNSVYLDKAKKMGDFLRYGMYDKYFQKTGNASNGNPVAGTGKDASHYLMAWYTAWGGGLDQSGNWAWRIGASHAHQGYQNVVSLPHRIAAKYKIPVGASARSPSPVLLLAKPESIHHPDRTTRRQQGERRIAGMVPIRRIRRARVPFMVWLTRGLQYITGYSRDTCKNGSYAGYNSQSRPIRYTGISSSNG